MQQFHLSSHGENYEFLLRLYFGAGTDSLELAIKRAYLDLSRTVHGLGSHPKRNQIVKSAESLLISKLPQVLDAVSNQTEFDDWHEKLCRSLIDEYASQGFGSFHIGQAQKWVNMTLKYIFLFPALASQYGSVHDYCHMPIDKIILARLIREGLISLLRPDNDYWGRLDDYQKYLDYQKLVRSHYSGSAPLAVEFHLWPS